MKCSTNFCLSNFNGWHRNCTIIWYVLQWNRCDWGCVQLTVYWGGLIQSVIPCRILILLTGLVVFLIKCFLNIWGPAVLSKFNPILSIFQSLCLCESYVKMFQRCIFPIRKSGKIWDFVILITDATFKHDPSLSEPAWNMALSRWTVIAMLSCLCPGARFSKCLYIYELKYHINSCETMPANMRETDIYELTCSVWACVFWETQAPYTLGKIYLLICCHRDLN